MTLRLDWCEQLTLLQGTERAETYLDVFGDALVLIRPPVLRQPPQTLFALFKGSGDVLRE